jgi:hypothetical protein
MPRLRCPRRDDRRPDPYPSRGTGELGTSSYEGEPNLIGVAQAIGEAAPRA